MKQKIANQDKEIAEYIKELKTEKDNNKSKTNSFEYATEINRKQEESLNKKIIESEEANMKLMQELETSSIDAKAHERNTTEEKNQLTAENKKITSELENKQTELKIKEDDVGRLTESLSKEKEQLILKEGQLSTCEKMLSEEKSKFETETTSLRNVITRVGEVYKTNLGNLEKECRDLKKENELNYVQLTADQKKYEILSQKLQTSVNEKNKLFTDYTNVVARANNAEVAYKNKDAQLIELQNACAMKIQGVNALSDRCQTLLDSAVGENEKYKSEMSRHENLLKECTTAVLNKDLNTANLQSRLAERENDITNLKRKMENLVNLNNERTGITEKAAAVPKKKRKNFDPDE
jgi:chromosome segregation ATPase